MSKNLYDFLRDLQDIGWTLPELLDAVLNEQKRVKSNNRSTHSEMGRLHALAYTNLEVAILQFKKAEEEGDQIIPIVFIED